MSPYRKPMPSFTLVLTSAHHSFRPSTPQSSSAMLPTAPDFLMLTLDLRHDSTEDDAFVEDQDQSVDSQIVFEGDQPATFDHEARQTCTSSAKLNLWFLIRKLVSYKQKFVICKKGPNV